MENNFEKLQILSWNIEGLSYKLSQKNDEIQSIIQTYDIVDFIETFQKKSLEFSQSFPGFCVFESMRLCPSLKASGGVILLVNATLQKYTSQILTDKSFEEMIWLHINTTKLGLSKNTVIGCCYVPPKDSIFYNTKDVKCNISEIDTAISAVQKLYDDVHIVLMGDMNARTATELDYVQFDNPLHIPGGTKPLCSNVFVRYATRIKLVMKFI